MKGQQRWFWVILLAAFIGTVGLEVSPLINLSALGRPMPLGTEAIALNHSSPALAQDSLSNDPVLFRDPSGLYTIALLDGYQIHSLPTASVIEAPDGNLAYTVVTIPTFEPEVMLTNAALAQLARETFQQGEGFITKEFQPTQNGIKINWQGRVTIRGAQPLSGSIFAQQVRDQVFLLMIAATEAGQDAFAKAVVTLPSNLHPLAP